MTMPLYREIYIERACLEKQCLRILSWNKKSMRSYKKALYLYETAVIAIIVCYREERKSHALFDPEYTKKTDVYKILLRLKSSRMY